MLMFWLIRKLWRERFRMKPKKGILIQPILHYSPKAKNDKDLISGKRLKVWIFKQMLWSGNKTLI